MFRSTLEQAIARGMKPGGDLAREIANAEAQGVENAREARAVCQALRELPEAEQRRSPDASSSRVTVLTDLFYSPFASVEADEIFRTEGTAQLVRIYSELISEKPENRDDIFAVLRVLAGFRTAEGTQCVIDAMLQPTLSDHYAWPHLLDVYTIEKHSGAVALLRAFGVDLPLGKLRLVHLDIANRLLIDGIAERHPFDCDEGMRVLEHWLDGGDQEEAQAVATALAFTHRPEREALLQRARQHKDARVQMEANWTAAKLGDSSGIDALASYAKQTQHSSRALQYLEELGESRAAHDAENDPAFAAMAEFSEWLEYPTELGRPPDELEVVDSREMYWPPDGETKRLWLIRYRIRDTTGLADDDEDFGLVGGTTFCLFSYKVGQRPPEDGYAIHCYWELSGVIEVDDPGHDFDHLIKRWSGSQPENVRIILGASFDESVEYPQESVALAEATVNGEQGWIVFDGPRSACYPKDEMPADAPAKTVLMVHVGRQLLGFEGRPDRKAYLKQPTKRRPEAIVAAYERLLDQAREMSGARLDDALSSSGTLAKYLLDYADALAAVGQTERLRAALDYFAPHWQYPAGFAGLGEAAFRCGLEDLAERFYVQFRASYDDAYRGEEMDRLAEIWLRHGRNDEARQLLIGCLAQAIKAVTDAEPCDRRYLATCYRRLYETYGRLFPDSAADDFRRHGFTPPVQ